MDQSKMIMWLADDVIVLGREDVTMKDIRKPWSELVNPYEGTRLYVTSGVNDWMIPLRTEKHCAWEFIILEPAS